VLELNPGAALQVLMDHIERIREGDVRIFVKLEIETDLLEDVTTNRQRPGRIARVAVVGAHGKPAQWARPGVPSSPTAAPRGTIDRASTCKFACRLVMESGIPRKSHGFRFRCRRVRSSSTTLRRYPTRSSPKSDELR
jgi:hypothetical protein